jgi:hypothetical protein
MVKKMSRFIVIILLAFSAQAFAVDLPKQHVLKQNEQGEYYVVNKDKIKMIEASILKMGFNSRWILACIKHESIDSDLKRWVFVDVKNGGTYDSLHQENWLYFRDEAFPDLKKIKLTNYSDETCP